MSEETAQYGADGDSGPALRLIHLMCPECEAQFYSELPENPDGESKSIHCVECEDQLTIDFTLEKSTLNVGIRSSGDS